MRKTYFLICFFIRLFMKLFWHYKIINKERLKTLDNCIIASNHISAYDPTFIGAIMPMEISYLAKIEIFKNPIFARFLKYVNAIPIARRKIDRKAIENVIEKLRSGHSMMIFPEGTRKSYKAKPGIGKIAIQTQKDILPIFMINSDDFRKCFFRKDRLKIVIGNKIKIDQLKHFKETKSDYRALADFILEKINELKDEG